MIESRAARTSKRTPSRQSHPWHESNQPMAAHPASVHVQPQPRDNAALLPRLLNTLGVTAPQQRELFERLLVSQARRRVPPMQAGDAIAQAFNYHSSLTEHALGVVRALHGGEAAAPGEPANYDETALSLGLKSVRRWTDLLTCAPLRHAARLMLTPDQQRLLDWIAQGDAADHEVQDLPAP